MAEQTIQVPDSQQSGIFNGKRLLGKILQYWYLYIISLAICISYAWFKVHYATPMYKVYGQVLVQDDKNNNGTSQALSGGGNGVDFSSLFSGKTNMANELAIFQTTDLCLQVVKDTKLYLSYYHKGNVRSVELFYGSPFTVLYSADSNRVIPVSMELKFASSQGSQFTITADGTTFPWHFYDTLHYKNASFYFVNEGHGFDTTASYIFTVQNPEGVAAGIAGNLGAELLSTKSTIVNLVYNTNLPQKGIDVLGGIMKAYINRNLDMKNISSDSTIKFINSRIELVGGDLGDIETAIQRFKQENKIADLSIQSQQLVSSSSDYIQKLSDLEVQLQVIKTMLEYVQKEQNNRRPVPALINTDVIFGGLVTAYNDLQVQRDKILLSLKEDNPIVTNIDLQIAGLRGDIIRSLKSQQAALTISRQKLSSESSEVNGLIRNVPEQERRFLDYSREQSIKQALYLFLLQRREEIAIARASNSSNASIISSAKANYAPYEPVANTELTIGFMIGLALPTGFIIITLLLNNKVSSREDVTGKTPVTILSEIGHSSKLGLLNLTEEGRTVIAEQFRIFRTNMDFALANASSPVIVITSCLSGEGKSFIAANLGQIYAISGKRTLLMELDLRKPKLSKMLDLEGSLGFSNYIISNRPITDYIQPVANQSSLFILPSGPIPPNPAEMLLDQRLPKMIEDLKQSFDVIIIDTAPIGAVADAQIIGRLSDISLYIVRQGYSIKNSIDIVNDIVLNNKLSNLYLVLNDVKEGGSYKYGYGYGYGYSYINIPEKKKSWWRKNKPD